MDADTANSAAMDTILQATKAAGKGNVIAGNALANLSTAAGMDLEGLESGERAGLLMEVLQQNQTQTQSQPPSDPDAPYPKLDLTLQGFREDNGRIFIPPTVRYVEKTMRADKESVLARDALPIQGDEQFFKEGTRLIYGAESTVWKRGLVSAVQAHTITGALRIAASFLSRFPPGPIPGAPKAVYCPTPTTPEDELAMKESGLDVRRFRFLDQESGAVDWAGIREDLQEATPRSVVLLYVSGTVPTGVEINASQWRILTTLLAERQLVPLCVLPFQGLSSGDVDRDAQPVKFMVHEGLPVVVVQSFDAGMGIYADSPSIISVATQSTETKDRVDSQLRAAARAYHSHPAPWGAHIVWSILSDSKLYPAWMNEIKAMSGRLRSVREKLYDVLTNKLKTPGSWLHIKRSSGMLCTALLPPSQVSSLAQSRNIHLNMDGSFSLGALNAPRIEVLAKGIDYVVRQSIREQEEAQAQAIAMELALAAAREQAAKEEAEAAERAARDAEEKAREEDTLLMEASIADAMEMQRREEEEEKRREEERREMDEAIRKAAERADMQRRAEEILASIGAMN
ncbi:aspartate aminotransferase-P2, mitochondrial precursor [Dioszegia hungarica]|uniref:Aspartate aminotransferase-P2, mitochondrial n=1 Tax=Dioszegia hungarica TaxID=4972 RepID=A0AA38LSU0_9TREE|nr:aspartate aminotransferase-P2, mitochondrial precursor [Dioszegia hungarica]KAI9633044.1 aspartate aminotransferase-P2, mitochondrial precursor [Dioszegia hungarica]